MAAGLGRRVAQVAAVLCDPEHQLPEMESIVAATLLGTDNWGQAEWVLGYCTSLRMSVLFVYGLYLLPSGTGFDAFRGLSLSLMSTRHGFCPDFQLPGRQCSERASFVVADHDGGGFVNNPHCNLKSGPSQHSLGDGVVCPWPAAVG